MARPRKVRFVEGDARTTYYKPRGIPLVDLSETVLSLDGLEALRHADAEGLDQTEAAERMGISRSTFSRLLAEARHVVATALTRGWAIRIEGGPVTRTRDGAPTCRESGRRVDGREAPGNEVPETEAARSARRRGGEPEPSVPDLAPEFSHRKEGLVR